MSQPLVSLFTNDGGTWNACVGWAEEEWYGYAEGYRRAGRRLAELVAHTQSEQDYLIYPIVFLYRQALEVALKHLIFKGSQLLGEEPIREKGHSLTKLWKKCRPMILKVWPKGPKEELKFLDGVIAEFEAKDPDSTAFRYPTKLTGENSLPVQEQINIVQFADVAESAFELLDACGMGFSQCLSDMGDLNQAFSDLHSIRD